VLGQYLAVRGAGDVAQLLRRLGADPAREHVEDLQQLELVVQVVLEPEPDVALVGRAQQLLIAALEELEEHHAVAPAVAGDERRALRPEQRVIHAARNRAFVEDVAPRQHRIIGRDGLDLGDNGVTISDV
jgi:hypothetical protein